MMMASDDQVKGPKEQITSDIQSFSLMYFIPEWKNMWVEILIEQLKIFLLFS